MSFVLNDLNNTIKIEPFIAYTSDGERINMYKQIRSLAMDKSDPDDLDCVSKVHSSRRFLVGNPILPTISILPTLNKADAPKHRWKPEIGTRHVCIPALNFMHSRPGIDDDEYRTVAGTTSMFVYVELLLLALQLQILHYKITPQIM